MLVDVEIRIFTVFSYETATCLYRKFGFLCRLYKSLEIIVYGAALSF
jgi:hypothetical protein